MQDQRAMLEDRRSEMQEKLRNLRAYAKALRQKADEHDVEEQHFAHDLMRVENDAQYYEAEIGRLTEALGGAESGGALAHQRGAGAVSAVAACVAFAAGVVLGWALLPPRGGR
ncbi:MAG TPA: hypothetical protein VG148_04565 [Pyrinomonadaceae bacterium]|nr:hypothetical protein [Pyrinomonadaceae bacterium]